MTNEEIQHWLKHHEGVHPKEIGLRVGPSRELLEELLWRRQEAQADNILDQIFHNRTIHQVSSISEALIMSREEQLKANPPTKSLEQILWDEAGKETA